MRTETEIRKQIKKIIEVGKNVLNTRAAVPQDNPGLALSQVAIWTTLDALYWALGEPRPKFEVDNIGPKDDNCYECAFKENVPGNAHIKCANPDPHMTGDPHGIKKGWFFYPLLFDPTWKTRVCCNFKKKKDVT